MHTTTKQATRRIAASIALAVAATMSATVSMAAPDGEKQAAVESAIAGKGGRTLADTGMCGRNLYIGIVQATVEREAAGIVSAWPRTVAAKGVDKDDIAGRAFNSAADYFAALYDVKNYGTADWAPYVEVDSAMLGDGAVAGNAVVADALDWSIAANVTDRMSDNIPVLVSANFNPALLLRKWDRIADAGKILPVGPASGAAKSMFDDKAVVMVFKSGAAKTIKAEDLTYKAIYGVPFDDTGCNPPLVYLTPNGVAAPTGEATGSIAAPDGWTDDFDAAKARAKAEGKLLLVDFSGSDWCCWCQRLDEEVFSKREFVEAATNDFVLVLIDSPEDESKLSDKAKEQNPKLVEEYGIEGFPTVLVMDADGNRLCETGYRRGGPKPYLEKLAEIKKAVDSGEDLAKKEREEEAARKAAAKKAESEKRAAVEAAMKKHWTDDFDAAKARAKAEGKCLLVYFCDFFDDATTFVEWSKELEEEVFTNEEFVETAKKDYVLVKVVVPRKEANLSEKTWKQNEELVKKYDARLFLPIVVVMDAEGEELGKTTSASYLGGGPLKYLEAIAAKKTAGLECRKLKESVAALEKGSPERIAKIDELFQKIGEREANRRRDLYGFAKELVENDVDRKFAEKYPFFYYVMPAAEKERDVRVVFFNAAKERLSALGYALPQDADKIRKEDRAKVEKEAAVLALEKIPETRKAIEAIKASAPTSVHMLIDRLLADLNELEEIMNRKAKSGEAK